MRKQAQMSDGSPVNLRGAYSVNAVFNDYVTVPCKIIDHAQGIVELPPSAVARVERGYLIAYGETDAGEMFLMGNVAPTVPPKPSGFVSEFAFRENVISHAKSCLSQMTEREQRVVQILIEKYGTPVTQQELADAGVIEGSHPKHEGWEMPKEETTLRMVRQVIKDIRNNHGIGIVSSQDGYWLPNKSEAVEYLERTVKQMKAWIASATKTYNVMRNALGDSVPKQGSLMELIMQEED